MNAETVVRSVKQFIISAVETVATAQQSVPPVYTLIAVIVLVCFVFVKRRNVSSSSVKAKVSGITKKDPSRVGSRPSATVPRTTTSGAIQPESPWSAAAAAAGSGAGPPVTEDCAWEQRRRRGIAAHSLHEKNDAGNERPFGSSYYYAHNNTRATGGYKDGLTMEDFTMNGPRLLSRGGTIQPVVSDGSRGAARDREYPEDSENVTARPQQTSSKADTGGEKRLPSSKRSIAISRYLWDDPGDAKKGIATIRIEEVPGKRSTDPLIPWKDACIAKVRAQLIGDEGLLVIVETNTDVDYELRIPMLYGQVAEVEALAKQKRLLLRLKKKTGLWNKSNLQAWPHPQKKTS